MLNPTLTMSPALHTNSTFARSRSSPNIPDLVLPTYTPSLGQEEQLPRAASFNCLSALEEKDIQRFVSADVPGEAAAEPESQKEKEGKPTKQLPKEERPKLERIGRRKSLVARPKSWIQRVRGSPERPGEGERGNTILKDAPPMPSIPKSVKDSKTRTVSESFATFAKKSWLSSSRSPSPSRNTSRDLEVKGKNTASSKLASGQLSVTKHDPPSLGNISERNPKYLFPTSVLQKTKQKPQSVLLSFKTLNSTNSSTSSLPRSSTDNQSTPRTSTDKIPPLLKKKPSVDKVHVVATDPPRRRDELWSAFRSLENDFSKFQTKSWSLKTNIVRSSLLPFLRNHFEYASNISLRPEDLDRRIAILNKWWAGLLEVLDGKQNQTVSGVDRPILLEACYGIMTRPEWRLAPSQFAPLVERSPNLQPNSSLLPREQSSVSLSSSASQFMVESAYHNARILFIQNLLTQMSFVVDKMSLRHAPASLVTFCGKAIAYAFFFVPGVAEALVRVWKLHADVLRRVSDQLDMPRRLNKVEGDEVITLFPPHLHCLGWTGVKTMANQLRQTPQLPILAARINWFGPWTARWCGRDSDLFFVFTKYYHILAEEFMLPGLSLVEKARVPGFMLVQAQILTALDSTIHRQPPAEPLPITFDDVLAGADASATALPIPSNNSARPMAENRLIMLIRDFMSERPSDFEAARLTFAQLFEKMMQAGARRTSVFDHNACFVLCDFMEEALSIYVRFHHAHALESDFIDWPFWLEVCKKMLESQNSMSEIRLFAFIYGAWHYIAGDERRKQLMCLDWLLKEETFDKFFNHWCPMVRAYYMRLLCWRLCRDDGDATELDKKIFLVVATRLRSNWAYYLYQKQQAEKTHVLPPSTAPCYPAPGRRLLIIRNDNQAPVANLFLGFDGLMSSSIAREASFKRQSSLLARFDAAEGESPKLTSDGPSTPSKKRWTFMGKMLPGSFSAATDPDIQSKPPLSPTRTLEDARRETALARTRPPMHSKKSSSDSETPPTTSAYRAFSFKFSLEWSQHFEKPMAGGGVSRNGVGVNMGPERRITSPKLPSTAQNNIDNFPNVNKEVLPKDPRSSVSGLEMAMGATYAGRALSEWAIISQECNNFVDRRLKEGVPSTKWVEVPTLGVEGFRKSG